MEQSQVPCPSGDVRSMQETMVPGVTLVGAERFVPGRPETYRPNVLGDDVRPFDGANWEENLHRIR